MDKHALTNEDLCALARNGDSDAVESLIKNNFDFIRRTAERYQRQFKNLRVERDDLVQEGCIGFLKAIEGFDPARNAKFINYAGVAVENAILDYIRRAERLRESQSDDFDFSDRYEIVSDDDFVEKDRITFDEYSVNPEWLYIRKKTAEELHAAINSLSERERAYIKYRFGFDEEDTERPLYVTAEHFHLSKSRAGKIEKTAFGRIRNELNN